VVDGVHFMDAVEAFGVLVDVLLLVQHRVVALDGMVEVLLQDLVGHARALACRTATVIHTVKVEMDPDAIGEGILRVIRGGQRYPPDRGEIGGHQGRRADQGQEGDQSVLVGLHGRGVKSMSLFVPRREHGAGCHWTYFFFFAVAPALGLHIEPGMERLAW
jgi:hypothetical protein